MTGSSSAATKAAQTSVEAAVARLDRDDVAGADGHVEAALAQLTQGLSAAWLDEPGPALMQSVGPEAGRVLARALWLGSTVDELSGRTDRARTRCLRAMELYARLRGPAEALDLRAARELGSASARLGATNFSAAHGRH